ncbi:MAG: hypothetical protein AAF692_09835 [Pseudomonadota bacterium]
MMLTAARMRQIGWGVLLSLCILVFTILSLSVHAVQNEVVLAERQIIALKRETLMLETEFESRANQRQLANWNRVEFGYKAPRADQYLDDRRQLAALGQPRAPEAPSPVRLARTELASLDPEHAAEKAREMVSPVSGTRIVGVSAAVEQDAISGFSEAFEEFLLDTGRPTGADARTGSGAFLSSATIADTGSAAASQLSASQSALSQAGNAPE